ncbi:heavy metal translocating P-type ATPase [Breoghania sp.]|uniref:heavy metal translocating P-type ATPase n=1 Tax=Breoghania sp. TaxID=2065378 RepID=UPI0026279EA8|nr:heavy metal translocating P-type ATPase [Breoghania sp.]MDJ0930628.1 heavy metal translocating P-type ATPase [Breoghania sp.]
MSTQLAETNAESSSAVQLDITGMTCAACSTRVEKVLKHVPGVADATVNLAMERADIAFNDNVKVDDLVAAVEKSGYHAFPRANDAEVRRAEREERERETAREERHTFIILVVSALLAAPLVAQMIAMTAGLSFHLSPIMELVLAAPVQVIAGTRFYRGAFKALRGGSANMDVLVALGTSAAFFYSLYHLITLGNAATGHLYFEASAVILTLIVFGKLLEAWAKRSTTAAVRSLMALRPESANRLTETGTEVVPISALRLGDRVLVKPGERVPVDGTVREGTSELDESLITGESLPVLRSSGGDITAGTINGSGALIVEATVLGEDTTLSRIIRLVENAQTSKAPVQRLADKLAAVFVPTVVGIAALTFVVWLVAGGTFENALIAVVAVMVIACPCALGLATPTALVAGTGAAARSGILVKDIQALETAVHVDTVVFDKTGTLTEGRPEVTDIQAFDYDPNRLLCIAASAQTASEHPLAHAMVRAAEERRLELSRPTKFEACTGRGLVAEIAGQPVAIGNAALMDELGIDHFTADDMRRDLENQAKTSVMVAGAGRTVGVVAMADQPREGAADALAKLKHMGVRTLMLTGDSPAVTQAIAAGLDLDDVEAGIPPDGKAARIEALRKEGATVAMVGDGLNDAPALASADIGIAMGSGADVALETAGITLMRSDPRMVVAALEVSRATVRKIRQNLFWAFIYNVVGILLAAMGFLSPAIAGAAMAMSSILVVTNAGLLWRWKAKV